MKRELENSRNPDWSLKKLTENTKGFGSQRIEKMCVNEVQEVEEKY